MTRLQIARSLLIFLATLGLAIANWGNGHDWAGKNALSANDVFELLGIVFTVTLSWFNRNPVTDPTPPPWDQKTERRKNGRSEEEEEMS